MSIGSVHTAIHQQNFYDSKAVGNQVAGDARKADDASGTEARGGLKGPHDEYIPSSNNPEKVSGVYRVEKDGNVRKKIVFDRPDSSEKSARAGTAEKEAGNVSPKVEPEQNKDGESPDKKDGPEKSGDKKGGITCTVNTDKVDAEITKLKAERQRIEQALKNAGPDENKRRELEKQLSQVESELSAKDNNAYRKQHATFTYS